MIVDTDITTERQTTTLDFTTSIDISDVDLNHLQNNLIEKYGKNTGLNGRSAHTNLQSEIIIDDELEALLGGQVLNEDFNGINQQTITTFFDTWNAIKNSEDTHPEVIQHFSEAIYLLNFCIDARNVEDLELEFEATNNFKYSAFAPEKRPQDTKPTYEKDIDKAVAHLLKTPVIAYQGRHGDLGLEIQEEDTRSMGQVCDQVTALYEESRIAPFRATDNQVTQAAIIRGEKTHIENISEYKKLCFDSNLQLTKALTEMLIESQEIIRNMVYPDGSTNLNPEDYLIKKNPPFKHFSLQRLFQHNNYHHSQWYTVVDYCITNTLQAVQNQLPKPENRQKYIESVTVPPKRVVINRITHNFGENTFVFNSGHSSTVYKYGFSREEYVFKSEKEGNVFCVISVDDLKNSDLLKNPQAIEELLLAIDQELQTNNKALRDSLKVDFSTDLEIVQLIADIDDYSSRQIPAAAKIVKIIEEGNFYLNENSLYYFERIKAEIDQNPEFLEN